MENGFFDLMNESKEPNDFDFDFGFQIQFGGVLRLTVLYGPYRLVRHGFNALIL